MGTKKKAHPTKYQGIFRYLPRGTLYARFKIHGKQVRQSLKTTDLELPRARLAEPQLAESNTSAGPTQPGETFTLVKLEPACVTLSIKMRQKSYGESLLNSDVTNITRMWRHDA